MFGWAQALAAANFQHPQARLERRERGSQIMRDRRDEGAAKPVELGQSLGFAVFLCQLSLNGPALDGSSEHVGRRLQEVDIMVAKRSRRNRLGADHAERTR